MLSHFFSGFYRGVRDYRRVYVGYFAPVIAAFRLSKKHNWNYSHQICVVYRYAFRKRKTQ